MPSVIAQNGMILASMHDTRQEGMFEWMFYFQTDPATGTKRARARLTIPPVHPMAPPTMYPDKMGPDESLQYRWQLKQEIGYIPGA